MTNRLSDHEVEMLVRISNAGIKEWKRHLYTLGISVPHHYNLGEQLEAIKQLGESRNERALDYLRKLNETDFELCNPCDRMDGSGRDWYPNAKGQLYKALDGFFEGYGYGAGIPAHQKPDEEARKIVREALSQLEKTFGDIGNGKKRI